MTTHVHLTWQLKKRKTKKLNKNKNKNRERRRLIFFNTVKLKEEVEKQNYSHFLIIFTSGYEKKKGILTHQKATLFILYN